MPGIDLIDLKDPLLHEREQGAIRLIIHPDDKYPEIKDSFWYLWTAKEAIFKAKRDLTNFDPKDIRASIYTNNKELQFESGEIKGKFFRKGDVILAIADKDLPNVNYKMLQRRSSNDSSEIRAAVVEHFKTQYNLKVKVISDGNGLPVLDYKNLPISLTHHARYMAFAYHKF